jgi:hypothetical protein
MTEPRLNWIGTDADPTDGMCKCTPTPGIPINMCPYPAEWHVLVLDNGAPVSLLVCTGHYDVATELGERVLTFHRVDRACLFPGLTRRTLVNPDNNVSHCQSR